MANTPSMMDLPANLTRDQIRQIHRYPTMPWGLDTRLANLYRREENSRPSPGAALTHVFQPPSRAERPWSEEDHG